MARNITRAKILSVEKQGKTRVLVVHSAEGAVQVEGLQEEAAAGVLTVEEEAVDPVEGMVEEEGEGVEEVREGVGGLLVPVQVPVPRETERIRRNR